jgi:hypothetical protein
MSAARNTRADRHGDYMNDLLRTAPLSLLAKGVAAVIGILAIYVTFRVLKRTLPRHFSRADARYRARKLIVFCGYVAVLFLAILFEDRVVRLSFAIGIAGAGLAVALQDVSPALPEPARSAFRGSMP